MQPAIVLVYLLSLLALGAVFANKGSLKRPEPDDAPSMARWLVSSNDWGVISTVSIHLNGIPFGNVASYSDGPDGNSTGAPYFYLSSLDPTPRDLAVIPYCSLTVSESPLGTCGSRDVENPTCAKITLSGQMRLLGNEDWESTFAAESLFSKHPEMQGWPKDHNFQFYRLTIQDIFLIDWYGGAQPIAVEDYLKIGYSFS